MFLRGEGSVPERTCTPRGTGVYVRDGNLVYSIWKDTKCIVVMATQKAQLYV